MGTQKYIKESCYHCIECSVVNFLAALKAHQVEGYDAIQTTVNRKEGHTWEGIEKNSEREIEK